MPECPSSTLQEGLISKLLPENQFRVDGRLIDASNAFFKNGVAGNLALDVEVEVEGQVENGVIIAVSVEFEND